MVKNLYPADLEQSKRRKGLLVCKFLDQVEQAIVARANDDKGCKDECKVVGNVPRQTVNLLTMCGRAPPRVSRCARNVS
jgi:hypothetical protein